MGQLGLSLVYVLPLVLVAWIWVGGERTRRFRYPVLLLLPIFYWLHWQTIEELSGWPTTGTLPENFEMVSAVVVEPDPRQDEAGEIYLWIRSGLREKPRAHVLPYSRELHEMVHMSNQRIAQGIRQQGTVRGRERDGNGASLNNGLFLVMEDATQRILPAK